MKWANEKAAEGDPLRQVWHFQSNGEQAKNALKHFTEGHTRNKFASSILGKLGPDLDKVLRSCQDLVGFPFACTVHSCLSRNTSVKSKSLLLIPWTKARLTKHGSGCGLPLQQGSIAVHRAVDISMLTVNSGSFRRGIYRRLVHSHAPFIRFSAGVNGFCRKKCSA